MQANEIVISVDALRNADIDSVVASAERPSCQEYHSAFDKLAKEAKKNNEGTFPVWVLLSSLTSMSLKSSDANEPFGPMFILDNSRGAIPNDITSESLEALSEWMPEISDAELRARITDILWLRLRKPEFIKIAVIGYIESALKLEDPEHWTSCAFRIQRAFRLGSLLRRQEPSVIDSVVKCAEEIISKYDGKDPLFLSLKLMEYLCEFDYGDAVLYYDLSCKIAEQAQAENIWHKAEKAWEVAELWAKKLKSDEKRDASLTQLAESLAQKAIDRNDGLASSKFMQEAIEVYRRVPNSSKRRKELYVLLRGFQRKSLEQMKKLEGPKIDISKSIDKSRKAVQGKSFEDAIFNFAFTISRPPNYDQVKEQSIEDSKKYIFSSIIGATHFDSDGLVVAEVPSMLGVDGEDAKAVWASMLRTIAIHHGLVVQGAIEPARREIVFEHNIIVNDLLEIVKNNPFVPPGHEYLYAKGLYAGLMGDFIEAAHLLVPQIENSLRYVLQQNDVEVTTLNTQGVQERIRIGKILEHEVIIKIFGKDVVLDLQALLIERKYSNLRNEISHGFMQEDSFFQPAVIYLWWLVVRLCLTPYYKEWKVAQNRKKR